LYAHVYAWCNGGHAVLLCMNFRPVTIAVVLLAIIASGVMLYVLRPILIPFVLASLLAIMFRPLVSRLRSWRVPMPLSMIVVLAIAVGAVWIVAMITSSGIGSVIEKAPEYQVRLNDFVMDVNRWLRQASLSMTGKSSSFAWNNLISVTTITSAASATLGGVVSFLGDSALMLLFLVFMVVAGEHTPAKLRNAFANVSWFDAPTLYAAVNRHVVKYLQVKTLINLVNGLVSWAILEAFGVDFAPLLGLFTFFLHYIPNIGSLVSSVLPAFVFLLQTGSVAETVVMTAVLSGVQMLIGNVIEPKIMGDRLDLSPVLVLFSLALWGFMWGIVGMIISVPIMAIIKTVLEAFEGTRPLGMMMSSRVMKPQVPIVTKEGNV
jgi:AI-2 transport protein TqsA